MAQYKASNLNGKKHTLESNLCQALLDSRFMEVILENGTLPCEH